jgi:hypothetical protein
MTTIKTIYLIFALIYLLFITITSIKMKIEKRDSTPQEGVIIVIGAIILWITVFYYYFN